MNHARILTSVPRHPKFLRAGPAASWLWLAGVCYCQDALTDGFVSREAIHTLGIVKPLPLARKLVQVGLWHEERDGWQIHDYLDHNNSAEYIQRVRQERKAAGQKGGRARHPLSQAINQLDEQIAWDVLEQQSRQNGNPTFFGTFNGTGTRTAALPPQRCSEGDPDPNEHYAVITAVVTKDILPLRLEDDQLMAATLARCKELGIAHNADVVRKAIDSALFRYYRALRVEFDLPPDPRGIYHDHVRPQQKRGGRPALRRDLKLSAAS